ncbi:RidA family protein [Brevundimonas sp. Root1423]|uniref:RidA family protein n=1 Tax=Brevundimonas sp. Root1423 TaxID=1736462 RepID=UPI001F42A020|nr:RidA family protein [Brevundimonas sp. Root1423]
MLWEKGDFTRIAASMRESGDALIESLGLTPGLEVRHDLYSHYAYSAAIRSGDLLFVSGQVGSRVDGSPEPDFEAQVHLAFANLKATLEAGGCGLEDVVDVTTFNTDPENQFATVMAVKAEAFPNAPYPSWTALGVNWLAGFDFEIKVIARVPSGSDPYHSRSQSRRGKL